MRGSAKPRPLAGHAAASAAAPVSAAAAAAAAAAQAAASGPPAARTAMWSEVSERSTLARSLNRLRAHLSPHSSTAAFAADIPSRTPYTPSSTSRHSNPRRGQRQALAPEQAHDFGDLDAGDVEEQRVLGEREDCDRSGHGHGRVKAAACWRTEIAGFSGGGFNLWLRTARDPGH